MHSRTPNKLFTIPWSGTTILDKSKQMQQLYEINYYQDFGLKIKKNQIFIILAVLCWSV